MTDDRHLFREVCVCGHISAVHQDGVCLRWACTCPGLELVYRDRDHYDKVTDQRAEAEPDD